ncbi:cytochrome P450 [Apodospora peruviana]|uniref:Cytochrome P450 n=1 Tax=Apodospora peruviana TaxID=516989 RepID=A0AAE0M212_9PEZI|nr:cytochrome P450 [Apodospora peruviana]
MATSISAQALESLTLGRVAAAIFLLTVGSFIVDFTWKPRYSKSLPRVGNGSGVVGTVKNWFGYMTQFNKWNDDGYQKYSKHGHSYVVPHAPSRIPEIVVARSQTAWLLELPDRTLSAKEAHRTVLYNDYQFFFLDDGFPIRTVHKHLARNIVGVIPGVQEEIQLAIDDVFGTDTENWKSINLWEAWLGIVPRVTNRILISAPTCRNKEFLKGQVGFADDIVRNSFILNIFPRVLHPIVARLVTTSNWWHWRTSFKIAKPVIEQRLHDMARKAAGDPKYDSYEPEEDLVTWLIRQAYAEGLTEELNAEMISKRLLPVEFAAIHTTVITGHTLMLDLLSTDPAQKLLDILRDETSTVFREEGKKHWTKTSLSKLHRIDSAIKESMRLSHFATALTHRKVIAKEGITNPEEGWHAPYGSLLMINLAGTHHDPDIYENPDKYDAFRFSRAREAYDVQQGGDEKKNLEEAMQSKRQGMVTTSDTFLPFSHGRHACPGRFFVAHELKMIMAYLLENYEIKPIVERPKPMWIGETIVPPLDAVVEIRRRKTV